jgi:hypothetical protein
VNSFTQIDYILSPRQIVNATFHFNPEHTNFVNPDYFNPLPTTPSYAQTAYQGTLAHHLGLWGGTLDTSIAYQRFHTFIGAQGPADEIVTPGRQPGQLFRNAVARRFPPGMAGNMVAEARRILRSASDQESARR